MFQSMRACDILSEEQHPVSFWNKDPEQIKETKAIP